jgi:UDP-N-acetylglucosamine diphosphorylase / glucose-1-phosphate thymidylyltransferase / UDP-N-acetylgalactosamine diphosphorylase / glucosamine-1-phosphate N-acetyltransferase / galactosamine-1-phosphate N-acetyltransferase
MQATLLPPRNPEFCAPITSNRDLGSCLIANMPMRELISAELSRSGMQMISPERSCERTLRIPLDHWTELGALLLLARNPKPASLLNDAGSFIAWKGADLPDDSFEKIVTDANCFPIIYPWDLLRMSEEVLAMMDETLLHGDISPLASLQGCIRIGTGSRILPGTVIEGPVIIGANCQIGPNAYIRGATSIGANCYVGNGAEVKNSIIYQNTCISRQCYVGDSIIGAHVNLGAGTCTENHRHDGHHHVSMIQGKSINTGRLKFGAVIGDGVYTGVNTSIDAGVKIGIARTTRAGSYIGKDLL